MVSSNITTAKNIIAGMAALIIAMGVARFLYTPLMPIMQDEQGFGDFWGGTLGTANFAGYMVGALISMSLPAGKWKLYAFRTSLLLVVISTPMMVIHDWPSIHLLSRFLGGVAGALAMISGSSLLMMSLPKDRALGGMGLHFSGVGTGIVLTGSGVILLSQQMGSDGLWILATIVSIPLALISWVWMPKPVKHAADAPAQNGKIPWHILTVLVLIIYFLEGSAYVIDATFLVRIFKTNPDIAHIAEWSWVLLGCAVVPSSYAWSRLGMKVGHIKALLGAFILQTIGIILPVVLPNAFGAIAGAMLFGGTFIGIVSLVMGLGGKLVPGNPARLMGLFTLLYSISQMIGPIASGWVLEHMNNPSLPLWVGGGLSFVCVLLTAVSLKFEDRIN